MKKENCCSKKKGWAFIIGPLVVLILIELWFFANLGQTAAYILAILASAIIFFLIGALLIKTDVPEKSECTKIESTSLTIHQLKAPLSGIKLSLEMLLSGDYGKINEEQKDILKKTYEKSDLLIRLIDDLLDTVKINEGVYNLNLTPTSVEDIVQSVADFYQEEIKKKNIKFEFQKPSEALSKIMLDEKKIKLVVQNLFDNAIRYTPVGGSIKSYLRLTKKGLEFQIQDSGIGIPKDQQDKLFTRFFRARNAIKTEIEGSGLGLSITKNIIKAHNGEIWFESKENKGSTFYFNLPISNKIK